MAQSSPVGLHETWPQKGDFPGPFFILSKILSSKIAKIRSLFLRCNDSRKFLTTTASKRNSQPNRNSQLIQSSHLKVRVLSVGTKRPCRWWATTAQAPQIFTIMPWKESVPDTIPGTPRGAAQRKMRRTQKRITPNRRKICWGLRQWILTSMREISYGASCPMIFLLITTKR